MCGYCQIQGTRFKKGGELRDKSVPYFQYESGMLKQDSKPNYMIWKAFNTTIIKDTNGSINELATSKQEKSIRRYSPSQNHKKYSLALHISELLTLLLRVKYFKTYRGSCQIKMSF